MEDIVDARVLGKLKAIRDGANPFEHLERPGETRPQLATFSQGEGLGVAVQQL